MPVWTNKTSKRMAKARISAKGLAAGLWQS